MLLRIAIVTRQFPFPTAPSEDLYGPLSPDSSSFEVETLRRKISRLAALRPAAEFGHALAPHRVAAHGHGMGFQYVDGHVRAYHGKRRVPKGHLARMRLSMPATTDYWVVTTEANKSLTAVLPQVLEEVIARTAPNKRLAPSSNPLWRAPATSPWRAPKCTGTP